MADSDTGGGIDIYKLRFGVRDMDKTGSRNFIYELLGGSSSMTVRMYD